MVLIRNTQVQDVLALESLQQIVFPTLADEERLHAPQYLRHLEVFPEGQFVAMDLTDRQLPGREVVLPEGQAAAVEVGFAEGRDSGRVVGMTTTMRINFDFDHYQHSFDELFAGGWLGRHEPDGKWLYGLDIGIHPAYRGRGLARLLYRERQQLVRKLGLYGQLTGGMMNGYGAMAGTMSGESYYQEWLEGKREDPTLTPQRRIGFRPIALLPDYLHDPGCGNYGVLLRLDADQEV